jgi:hypothetical protein
VAVGNGGCDGDGDNNQLKAEMAVAATTVKVVGTYKNHSKRQQKKWL